MNQEFFTLNQQDLETLLSKGHCSCHFINPNKTRIILWKEIKDDTEIYYLRIGIQKFISYPLKDKNKALYWRFNCFEVKEKEGINSVLSQKINSEPSKVEINPDPNNPITKYQQRLQKTEALNHGKSTSSSEQSESISH